MKQAIRQRLCISIIHKKISALTNASEMGEVISNLMSPEYGLVSGLDAEVEKIIWKVDYQNDNPNLNRDW